MFVRVELCICEHEGVHVETRVPAGQYFPLVVEAVGLGGSERGRRERDDKREVRVHDAVCVECMSRARTTHFYIYLPVIDTIRAQFV